MIQLRKEVQISLHHLQKRKGLPRVNKVNSYKLVAVKSLSLALVGNCRQEAINTIVYQDFKRGCTKVSQDSEQETLSYLLKDSIEFIVIILT